MRNLTLTTLLLGTMLTSTPLVMATPTTIMDTSSDGTPTHNYPHADFIGGADFDYSELVVDFVGSTLKVDIYVGHNPDDWSGSSKFNLYQGMNYGHDLIEGSDLASFPEPATMLFCGTGLVGLAGLAGSGKPKKLPSKSPKSASSPNGEGTVKGNYHQLQNSQVLAGLSL
jgi:hypothetical protein